MNWNTSKYMHFNFVWFSTKFKETESTCKQHSKQTIDVCIVHSMLANEPMNNVSSHEKVNQLKKIENKKQFQTICLSLHWAYSFQFIWIRLLWKRRWIFFCFTYNLHDCIFVFDEHNSKLCTVTSLMYQTNEFKMITYVYSCIIGPCKSIRKSRKPKTLKVPKLS